VILVSSEQLKAGRTGQGVVRRAKIAGGSSRQKKNVRASRVLDNTSPLLSRGGGNKESNQKDSRTHFDELALKTD
jgi:hypothetical protein